MNAPTAVMLNLFQHPLRGERSYQLERVSRLVVQQPNVGRARRWMLKQVQHDSLRGDASCPMQVEDWSDFTDFMKS